MTLLFSIITAFSGPYRAKGSIHVLYNAWSKSFVVGDVAVNMTSCIFCLIIIKRVNKRVAGDRTPINACYYYIM